MKKLKIENNIIKNLFITYNMIKIRKKNLKINSIKKYDKMFKKLFFS
jgi:hypothetical protein